jgi:hypothetical protein
MADAFFDNFSKELAQKMAPSPEAAPSPVRAAPPRASINWFDMVPREIFGLPLAFWIGTLIWLFIVFLILGPML